MREPAMIVALEGVVKQYHWGDDHTLASITGRPSSGCPEAEYWLGAHQRGPSRVVGRARSGPDSTLDRVIAGDPQTMLGPSTAERFGELPFLLKILAVARPLSIQAHPTRRQAQAGYEREDRLGIPVDGPTRSYRDRNHKPELICALTRMEVKCGFRTVDGLLQIASLFRSDPAARVFSGLEPAGAVRFDRKVQAGTVREVMHRLLSLSEADRVAVVEAVVAECRTLVRFGDFDGRRSTAAVEVAGPIPEPELARTLSWAVQAHRHYGPDVGVVSSLLLNHVVLEPGQALFLEAGNVHAYLRGAGVELMANSDNVLRCGLTSKHVDVDELLAVADFEPGRPSILQADGSIHRFAVPTPEFSLVRMAADRADDRARWLVCEPVGPEIVLATGGDVTVESSACSLPLRPGQAVFVTGDERRFRLRLDNDDAVAWRATIGR